MCAAVGTKEARCHRSVRPSVGVSGRDRGVHRAVLQQPSSSLYFELLLHLDALRADNPQLVHAHCTSKLIEVVLIELLTSEGRFLPPGACHGAAAPRGSLWREMHLHRVDVVIAVYGRIALPARLARASLVLQRPDRREPCVRGGALEHLPRLTKALPSVRVIQEEADASLSVGRRSRSVAQLETKRRTPHHACPAIALSKAQSLSREGMPSVKQPYRELSLDRPAGCAEVALPPRWSKIVEDLTKRVAACSMGPPAEQRREVSGEAVSARWRERLRTRCGRRGRDLIAREQLRRKRLGAADDGSRHHLRHVGGVRERCPKSPTVCRDHVNGSSARLEDAMKFFLEVVYRRDVLEHIRRENDVEAPIWKGDAAAVIRLHGENAMIGVAAGLFDVD